LEIVRAIKSQCGLTYAASVAAGRIIHAANRKVLLVFGHELAIPNQTRLRTCQACSAGDVTADAVAAVAALALVIHRTWIPKTFYDTGAAAINAGLIPILNFVLAAPTGFVPAIIFPAMVVKNALYAFSHGAHTARTKSAVSDIRVSWRPTVTSLYSARIAVI
jgi:hypothetical protein